MSVANDGVAACELVGLLVVAVDNIEVSYLCAVRIADGNRVLCYVWVRCCLPCCPVHNLNSAGLDAHGVSAWLWIVLTYDEAQLTLIVCLILLTVGGLYQPANKVCSVNIANVHISLVDSSAINSTRVCAGSAYFRNYLECALTKNPLLAAETENKVVTCCVGQLDVKRLDTFADFLCGQDIARVEVAEGNIAEITLQTFD